MKLSNSRLLISMTELIFKSFNLNFLSILKEKFESKSNIILLK